MENSQGTNVGSNAVSSYSVVMQKRDITSDEERVIIERIEWYLNCRVPLNCLVIAWDLNLPESEVERVCKAEVEKLNEKAARDFQVIANREYYQERDVPLVAQESSASQKSGISIRSSSRPSGDSLQKGKDEDVMDLVSNDKLRVSSTNYVSPRFLNQDCTTCWMNVSMHVILLHPVAVCIS